jgi:hypothetical protein
MVNTAIQIKNEHITAPIQKRGVRGGRNFEVQSKNGS